MSAANAFYAPDHRGPAEKILDRLFPAAYAECPPPCGPDGDVIHTTTYVYLGWLDRLRVLLTGHLIVHTKTATELQAGSTATCGAVYVTWKDRRPSR